MKTLKQSWLHGDIDLRSANGALLFATVQNFARIYFEKWSDAEVERCWHDLEMLIDVIKRSKTIASTNSITIILNLPSLQLKESKEFLEKWRQKFESCTPFSWHWLHPKEFESGTISIKKTYSAPIRLEKILSALFILKQASCGNISAVYDMYSIVSIKQTLELQLVTDPVKKSMKASKESRKRPLTKLLEHFFKENPKINNNTIFKRLNNQTEDDKNICRIKSAMCDKKKGYVEYYNNKASKTTEKPIPYKNVISRIAKIRTRIKNKLP